MTYRRQITATDFPRRPQPGGATMPARITPARDPGAATSSRHRLPAPVVLFLVAQVLPWIIAIGPVRMSIYRFVLIAMLFPCLVKWITGRAGPIRVADIAILLYAAWCGLSLFIIHGVGASVQPAGIIFVEAVGSYMLARCYIRSADDFRAMVRVLAWVVAALLPFAVFESVTGRNIARELLASFYPTFPDLSKEARWGLRRAQTVFEHPILFGVVCNSAFTLSVMVLGYGQPLARRLVLPMLIGSAAFLSLSSGPLSGLVLQWLLIGWDRALKALPSRWTILAGFGAVAVIALELLSNRSVAAILISLFAFDVGSGEYRLQIWHYGYASIMNHPLFGIGFQTWVRASWMSPSIDMFWVVDGIRHGMPAEFLILLVFFSLYLGIVFKRGLDERTAIYRTAYLITMTSFFFVGWMVYFWNATYVVFIFLLASGAWILDAEPDVARHSHSKPRDRAGGRRRPVEAVG